MFVCVFSSLFFFFLDDFFIFFILTACSVTVLPQVLEAEKRKTAELYIYISVTGFRQMSRCEEKKEESHLFTRFGDT